MARANFLRNTLAGGLMLLGLLATPLILPQAASAQSVQEEALCEGSGGEWSGANGGSCSTPGSKRTVPGTIGRIVDILIFVVGAVSVLMIVIGGLRYTLSGGDEKAAAAGKNTIIFAVVGLVVSFAAYAIARFVIGALGA